MKLYKCIKGTQFKVKGDIITAPTSPEVYSDEILTFEKVDGMYSICHNEIGERVRLVAWTEIEELHQ